MRSGDLKAVGEGKRGGWGLFWQVQKMQGRNLSCWDRRVGISQLLHIESIGLDVWVRMGLKHSLLPSQAQANHLSAEYPKFEARNP